MIVIPQKNEKQILVICLIEQHKDNNDRSGKKSPNLYSPAMHMHEPEWSLAVHHQSLTSTLRKAKRLRRRLAFRHIGRVREDFQMRHDKHGNQS